MLEINRGFVDSEAQGLVVPITVWVLLSLLWICDFQHFGKMVVHCWNVMLWVSSYKIIQQLTTLNKV